VAVQRLASCVLSLALPSWLELAAPAVLAYGFVAMPRKATAEEESEPANEKAAATDVAVSLRPDDQPRFAGAFSFARSFEELGASKP
jgi:hypothetical protein